MAKAIPITLPELGAAARFSLWFVQDGERVYEGDRVAEVIVPGATYDVPAPVTGRVISRQITTNEPIVSGQVLGTMVEEE